MLPDKHATIPNFSEANAALRTAQRKLKAMIAKAKELCRAHLIKRAEMAHTIGKNNVERAINCILKAEAQKAMFSRLRRILKCKNRGALSHVQQVTDNKGNIRNVYDQKEINDLLIEWNAKHFSQADGTPFTIPPISTMCGRFVTKECSNRILDCEAIDNVATTDAVRALLEEARRIAPASSVSAYISAEDVRAGYKRWRESTSTSPSGLHLGHEKAIMRYDEEDGENRLSDRIFKLKATFLNMAIEHGHVYSRWKTIVNAMIEKIPGKPLLNKLRVIHLIESDFNLMTGILWGRRLMKQGERLEAFGDEQGGSRKDRRAQEILLFKHLAYSLVRMTKTNCATFDNDAKSCYDRIVMLFASICSQRLGMDPKACKLFLKTLDSAHYHVKTNLGISKEYYATSKSHTIHGPGQGGRSSPGIWTMISCMLIACMRKKSEGANFSDPAREISVSRVCSGFVDDITHIVNSFTKSLRDEESIEELTHKTQVAAQWWEELLNVTGGKLELQKCFFYLMYWKFDDEGVARLTTKTESNNTVSIRDSKTGDQVFIDRKDCDETHKTLGAMETPSGDYKAEISRLMSKSRAMAQRISSSTVSRHEAMVIFRSMYLPSISYSFPVGILSLKDAERVQGAPIQSILSALGYNSNMPREIVYGPQECGGIGLKHLFAEQGAIKTTM